MKARDKKALKVLGILGPILLLAVGYGYHDIQQQKARRAEKLRKARARQQQEQTGTQATPNGSEFTSAQPAADQGTRALPSPPPGATLADNHARVPSAALSAGIRVDVDTAAQNQRMALPWGRDPFVPPDTQGPEIAAPSNMESPRGKSTVQLRILISDRTNGNSGIASARLFYRSTDGMDTRQVDGRPPADESGDGRWTFDLPAPKDAPLTCYVVAVDNGRLRSQSRSKPFTITPPPKQVFRARQDGAEVRLTLRGISWADKKGVALINDNVLAEGEYVAGYEVVKIAKNAVVLKHNDQEIVLQLKE